jgi:Uma2 family endonuclease
MVLNGFRISILELRFRMSSSTQTAATLDDLYRVDGKAELIDGRIVPLMATGRRPSRVAFRIARSLDDYAQAIGRGEAYADNTGFAVAPLASGRESFSPDASYFLGPFPLNDMRFLMGPPVFAVEVRSENDYGEASDIARAAKRADYFEAGTLIVWDVDPIADRVLKYRVDSPDQPVSFTRGQVADAEPAVPGWTMTADAIFG